MESSTLTFDYKTGYVVPFILDHGLVRGRLIRLGSALTNIVDKHQYPSIINHYIGEMLSLGAALIMDLKASGNITLQITNSAIVQMLVVTVTNDGGMRACARFDENALEDLLAKTPKPSLAHLFAGAHFMFTVSLDENHENYQAIVELNGATLSECMHHYFRQSEQVPTGLFLCTDYYTPTPTENRHFHAGGILLQRMPISADFTDDEREQLDDHWFTDISLLATTTAKEVLSADLSAEALLNRLFHERNLVIYDAKQAHVECICSRERVESMVAGFSEEEIKHITVDEMIEVTCDFCNETYVFNSPV